MENIGEKIAYLKGLAEGLKVDESTNEGRIIAGILDVLAEMNEYIVEIDDDLAMVQEEMDNLSDDLADVEDIVFEDDEDDCDCDCDCDDEDVYEITCPNCGEEVYVDGETLETEDIYCPSCRQQIELDLPEGCGCGCDCDCDCED